MEPNATLLIEDARIIFRNFEGRETEYNAPGNRNFSVQLPADFADSMRRDGWNIKERRARDDESEPEFHIPVAVGFKIRPPKLVLINSISKRRTILDEDTCELLDWADILTSDVIIRAREWSMRGNSGIKAYLKTLYAIIDEDVLDLKYADVLEQKAVESAYGDYIDGEVIEQKALEGPRG